MGGECNGTDPCLGAVAVEGNEWVLAGEMWSLHSREVVNQAMSDHGGATEGAESLCPSVKEENLPCQRGRPELVWKL